MKTLQRTFIPGDVWIYFKIYTGIKTADLLLTNTLWPVIHKMLQNKLIKKFYFIRFNDPDFHLRLRFLLADNADFGEAVRTIHKALKPAADKQFVWKIQLDTYQREMERYNAYLMEDTESLFSVDSICLVRMIKHLNKIQDEKYRWMISLLLIDNFLSDWNFTLEQKKDFMSSLSNAFKIEFGFDKYNSKQFNEKYRNNKAAVEQVLKNKMIDDDYHPLLQLVSKRSAECKEIINHMQRVISSNKLNIYNYLGSYLHMTMNRLFRTDNRLYELLIYDFMKRYYISQVAIHTHQPVTQRK